MGATAVELESELPACTSARRGAVFYVKSRGQLRYCDGRSYQLLQLGASDADSVAGADLDLDDSPLMAEDIAGDEPRFVRYLLDLGDPGIQPDLLTVAAQRALTGPEAEHVRDGYAVDILAVSSSARLIGLGDELDYLDDLGARVELVLSIYGLPAAAIVVGSMLPFDGPQERYADYLLRTQLELARAAEANVARSWDKTLVVIFTDTQTADLLEEAYAALPESVRGDSIVVVVESLGETIGLFHQSV